MGSSERGKHKPEENNSEKLGKGEKLWQMRQLSRSCQEGIPAGAGRAGEGEGPEAGRKSTCYFTDVWHIGLDVC